MKVGGRGVGLGCGGWEGVGGLLGNFSKLFWEISRGF